MRSFAYDVGPSHQTYDSEKNTAKFIGMGITALPRGNKIVNIFVYSEKGVLLPPLSYLSTAKGWQIVKIMFLETNFAPPPPLPSINPESTPNLFLSIFMNPT